MIKTLVDLTGHSLRIDQLEVFAPFDIGLFVSLCLASRRPSRRRRLRALLLGIALLPVMEVVVLLVATCLILRYQLGALAGTWVETIGWVNPLILWWGLLSRWELPTHPALEGDACEPRLNDSTT